MAYIIYSILFTVGILLSLNGNIIGTSILFALTGFHLISAIILFGVFSNIFTPAKTGYRELIKRDNMNNSLSFLMLVFLAISTFHLYTLGYILYAGMLISTISISALLHLFGLPKNEH